MASQLRSLAGSLSSAGRIIDPLYEAVYTGGSSVNPALCWLYNRIRVRRDSRLTSLALGQLKSSIPTWSESSFLSTSLSTYTAVMRGENSRAHVTESLYSLMTRGASATGATVLRSNAPPRLLQARLVYPPNATASGMGVTPDKAEYVQLAVQYSTLQAPVARGGATSTAGSDSDSGSSRRNWKGKGGGGKRPARALDGSESDSEVTLQDSVPTQRQMVEGEWIPILHAAVGRLYYYHTASRAVTWTPPPASQCVPRSPFRVETAGYMRTPDAAAAAAEGYDAPLMRVVHNVVWERRLPRAGAAAGTQPLSTWRIAKL